MQSLISRLLTWPIIQSFIRHGFTSGGALLISHGLASQTDTNTAIGAAMALIGFGWSVFQKWESTKPVSQSASQPTNRGAGVPLLLALIAGGTLFFTGCKTAPTPQQATYAAVGTTIVSVDAAMNLWGVYVANNHPSTNIELTVEAAYQKYQSSMAITCDAGEAYAATGGTNATAVAALNQAIANQSQELTDLETLLTSLGVKLQ
ncbi:MAG TPA: hypothetical protein VH280_14915 [Verrucomicrobiae bacterium]|jgi:hypothetical protein|nr:hypothetical protein [Verrucomicrobiae bacterium]